MSSTSVARQRVLPNPIFMGRAERGTLPKPQAVDLTPRPVKSALPFSLAPGLAEPRPGVPVVNPRLPPVLPRRSAMPPEEKPTGPLMIAGAPHWPIALADLQPGDIGFDYRRVGRSAKQNVISMGEQVLNVLHPENRGSPHVLHTFMVLQAFPGMRTLRVADAASGGPKEFGVGMMDMDYGEVINKEAYHVFYRFKDPRLQERMAYIARLWSEEFVPNFSTYHAVRSPFARTRLTRQAQQELLHLARHAYEAEPMPAMDGKGWYEVMCAEWVADVICVALMSLYCDDHIGVRLGDPQALRALQQGPAGSVVDANPRALAPSAFSARLARDPSVETLGYMYAIGV